MLKQTDAHQVLPAASSTFLQEVGMHITEPLALPEGDIAPGIYMMGQVAKKFILRPDINQLLTELDQKRQDDAAKEALGRVKKEEDLDFGTKTVDDLLAPAPSRPASPTKAKAAKGKRKAAAP